jgi:hypothetical protein
MFEISNIGIITAFTAGLDGKIMQCTEKFLGTVECTVNSTGITTRPPPLAPSGRFAALARARPHKGEGEYRTMQSKLIKL